MSFMNCRQPTVFFIIIHWTICNVLLLFSYILLLLKMFFFLLFFLLLFFWWCFLLWFICKLIFSSSSYGRFVNIVLICNLKIIKFKILKGHYKYKIFSICYFCIIILIYRLFNYFFFSDEVNFFFNFIFFLIILGFSGVYKF